MLSSKGINGQFVYEMPVADFVQGVLSVAPDRAAEVTRRFRARELAVAEVGRVTAGDRLELTLDGRRAPFWDHRITPYIGRPFSASSPPRHQGGHHA